MNDRSMNAGGASRPMTGAAGALLLALLSPHALAYQPGKQDPARLLRIAEQLLASQTAALPGRVDLELGSIDPRLQLAACPQPEAFVPPGVRLWGNAMVGVRCEAPSRWTVYLPVTVRVQGMVYMTARPLVRGQVIQASDIAPQEADLTQLPAAAVTDPNHAIGKSAILGVGSGQVLRFDMLRSPPVVRQGQVVRLVSRGPGFMVTAEGRAMGQAAEGQVTQVRAPSGQVVSGIARSGPVVEVTY